MDKNMKKRMREAKLARFKEKVERASVKSGKTLHRLFAKKAGRSDLSKEITKQAEFKEKLRQARITGTTRARIQATRERAKLSGPTTSQKAGKFFRSIADRTGPTFQSKVSKTITKRVKVTKRKGKKRVRATRRRIKRQTRNTTDDDGMFSGGFSF